MNLANPCDSVPGELFAQQGLAPQPSIWYPDNDPTIPDSSSNGCDVQVLNSKSSFTLTVTNRDFDRVRGGYSGLVKTDLSVQGKPLDGKRADVYQIRDTVCMVLVDLPGGTFKMDGSFTIDPVSDGCKRAVELARAFVPYISITQR
ncbi:hypothetical protein AB0L82_31215 [Nocardia sp. NPDC052001]|uniref:hypothetical protein n=1 Tax=Nocardia sp. NPDC052001 TaxID=3154853 RepID=UPI00342B5A8C